VFILFSFLILFLTRITMLWFASISLVIMGLYLLLYELKIQKKELYILSFFSFVYCLFFIFI
jgi:hypothetical protein